jgi:starch synthase (maltosyl-transferring)
VIVSNSEAVRRQVIDCLKIASSRVVAISNGVDDSFFSLTEESPPQGWPGGSVALVVGRYVAQKNHLGLLDAIARIQRRGAIGDWKFVFVGEGPLRDKIEQEIARVGLAERVVLMNPVTAMLPLYRASRLLILASHFEGMPNVALEAQAAGCPVAISVPANEAQAITEDVGWILDHPLDTSLQTVLHAPLSMFEKRGRLAQERIRRNFSVENMVRQTEALYDRVIGAASQ